MAMIAATAPSHRTAIAMTFAETAHKIANMVAMLKHHVGRLKMPRPAAYLLCVLAFSAAIAFASEVCRNPSFEGMEYRTKGIHDLIGKNTTNLNDIRVYVSRENGKMYAQSNYLSLDPEDSSRSSNPTKVLTNEVRDARNLLANIIYWGRPQDANWEEVVEQALKTTEFYVDRAEMDQNGRVPLDLTGAQHIRLASEQGKPHPAIGGLVETGSIETLPLEEPPPALVETIDGCCLKGRPPGRAQMIFEGLKERTIRQDAISILPMIVDSGTETVIRKSSYLQSAYERSGTQSIESWPEKLDTAFKSASGGTLVLLTHINGRNVEVLDPTRQVLFSIPVAELRNTADKYSVNLLLFGCDTAVFINDASQGVGVVGRYNTATAATRLDAALPQSTDVADLLKRIASPDLVVVAYDERSGNGYAGASAFAKVRGTGMLARVFRLLSIRGKA